MVLATVSLLFTACSKQQARTHSQSPPVLARFAAREVTLHPRENLAGIVAPFENVAIQSTLSEPVSDVYVNEGDRVRAGEVIARLDTSDLQAQLAADNATADADAASTLHAVASGTLTVDQGKNGSTSAQSAVEQARQTLARDQVDLNRDTSLLASGFLPAQQYDTQRTLVRNDQAALQSAIASEKTASQTVQANGATRGDEGIVGTTVAQARAQEVVARAQARQVHVSITRGVLYSPVDGVVVNRNINVGEYPGTRQLFTLQATDPIYIDLHGSSAQIAHIDAGSAAVVTASDVSRTGFPAHVVGILNATSPGSTDFRVKLIAPNSASLLRPGMPVSAEVDARSVRGVGVPTTAFIDDEHSAVFVFGAHNSFVRRSVREDGEANGLAVVDGLRIGDEVARNGQAALAQGSGAQ